MRPSAAALGGSRSRRATSRRALLGCAAWLALVPSTAAAYVLIEQERSATVYWETTVESDVAVCDGLVTPGSASDAAADAAPFTANIVVDRSVVVVTGIPSFPTIDCVLESSALGGLGASHDSAIDPGGFQASGGHSLAPLYSLSWQPPFQEVTQETSAESVYRVRFELTELTGYTLVAALTTWAPLSTSSGIVRLRRASGQTIEVLATSEFCPDAGGIYCPTVTFGDSGTLEPGIYEFEARTSGTARTAWDYGFGNDEQSFGEFEATLTFGPPIEPVSVPLFGASGLVGLATSLAAIGAACRARAFSRPTRASGSACRARPRAAATSGRAGSRCER